MRKQFLLIFSFAIVCVVGTAFSNTDKDSQPQLVVTGQGEVLEKPDRAILTFGVETSAQDIKQAQQENAKRSEAFMGALKKNGVAEKDIKTAVVQINPRYDYVNGKQRFAEYVAQKSFTVRMEDIDRYGRVVQAALEAGVNQVGGVEFDHSRRRELEEEAMKRAVQDARKKAEILAAAAGRTAGEALFIRAGSAEAPPHLFRGKMAAMDAAPVDQLAPGEIAIRTSVTVTYKLQ